MHTAHLHTAASSSSAVSMRATLLLAAACVAASRELKACSGVDEDSATPACEEWYLYVSD